MSNLKKKFTVDEEIVWKFEDFDSQGEQNVKCRIVEVHEASNEENFYHI